MTSVSTVLSPILTPFITYLLIGEKIAFDPVGMFLSILQIVILHLLGVALRTFLPRLARAATDYTPAVSALAISLIIGGVIGASKAAILANVGVIFLLSSCTTAWAMPWALLWQDWSDFLGKKQWPFPSKWACRIPEWRRHWPFCTSIRQRLFPALFSVSGTIFPVPSLPTTSLAVMNRAKKSVLRNRRPTWHNLFYKGVYHHENFRTVKEMQAFPVNKRRPVRSSAWSRLWGPS